MTVKLPDKLTYDDINGEEALEILHTRFYDLLHTLPELQKRFALSRVKMRLEIVLEIDGASPPKRIHHDQVEILALADRSGMEHKSVIHELEASVDSRSNPPDLVREEHGLPLPRAIRSAAGIMETGLVPPADEPKYARPPKPLPTSELPANLPSPTQKIEGRNRYASWVTQDYGSLQSGSRSGGEGPVIGGERIVSGAGGDHAPLQADFRTADYRNMDDDKAREILDKTVERGRSVEQILRENRNAPDMSKTEE
jgi:hypothetical protein